jgi:hypothetical protein
VLAALGLQPARAAAEPRPVDARIVWVRADRAYIAAADSITLAPGDLLTVVKGKRTIASGSVLQVLARDLAAARLASGSLDREKHLDRLKILAERPALSALPMLRIGFPGRGRANLLFDCGKPAPRTPFDSSYRADSLAENAYRFTRTGDNVYTLKEGSAYATPWPDTIAVRLFGEVSDEEIALERGEIDVAVFWPGEASWRLRADPRWRGLSHGRRGIVAASVPAGATITPDHPALGALNDELFRGDLAGIRSTPSAGITTPDAPRFVVDPSCPGRAAIERFLDRATSSMPKNAATIRLFYLDAPWALADSLHAAPLLAVRCAIAIEPGLRSYVEALGLSSIAGMLACPAAGRAP